MSEKTLWKWLDKKLSPVNGYAGRRLEGNCTKGVSDTVIAYYGEPRFVELKDWSGPKKHPLSIEQKNFCDDFGGLVLVKIDKKTIGLLHENFSPLMTSDLTFVRNNAKLFYTSSFDPEAFISSVLARSPRRQGPFEPQP